MCICAHILTNKHPARLQKETPEEDSKKIIDERNGERESSTGEDREQDQPTSYFLQEKKWFA